MKASYDKEFSQLPTDFDTCFVFFSPRMSTGKIGNDVRAGSARTMFKITRNLSATTDPIGIRGSAQNMR